MQLRCSNDSCHAPLALDSRELACPKCGDLLELIPEVSQSPEELKKIWIERRMSYKSVDVSGVWRFREVLPNWYGDDVVTLAEGNIPLIKARKAADYAGLSDLTFKHLGWNPTGCFKDLGMTTGMTQARHIGARAVGCASTGNTSASMAAYASRAGLTAKVYLPEGKVSLNKLAQAIDFGADIVQVKGSFDLALDTVLAESKGELYFLNSINPYRIEGQKTVVYELLEQLLWQTPDYIVCPGGNLGNSSAFGKALDELVAFGLIEERPKLVVVQARGSNPFFQMWRDKAERLTPVDKPETVATAIRIGNPRSWRKAMRGVKNSDGFVLDVSDEQIGEAKAWIGRDGVGCEPASATTLAGLKALSDSGQIDKSAKVIALLTGHGLKDTDFIIKQHANDPSLAGVI